jgi:hypothetical protein
MLAMVAEEVAEAVPAVEAVVVPAVEAVVVVEAPLMLDHRIH